MTTDLRHPAAPIQSRFDVKQIRVASTFLFLACTFAGGCAAHGVLTESTEQEMERYRSSTPLLPKTTLRFDRRQILQTGFLAPSSDLCGYFMDTANASPPNMRGSTRTRMWIEVMRQMRWALVVIIMFLFALSCSAEERQLVAVTKVMFTG